MTSSHPVMNECPPSAFRNFQGMGGGVPWLDATATGPHCLLVLRVVSWVLEKTADDFLCGQLWGGAVLLGHRDSGLWQRGKCNASISILVFKTPQWGHLTTCLISLCSSFRTDWAAHFSRAFSKVLLRKMLIIPPFHWYWKLTSP